MIIIIIIPCLCFIALSFYIAEIFMNVLYTKLVKGDRLIFGHSIWELKKRLQNGFWLVHLYSYKYNILIIYFIEYIIWIFALNGEQKYKHLQLEQQFNFLYVLFIEESKLNKNDSDNFVNDVEPMHFFLVFPRVFTNFLVNWRYSSSWIVIFFEHFAFCINLNFLVKSRKIAKHGLVFLHQLRKWLLVQFLTF